MTVPRLLRDLPCVGCRYNLRELAIDTKCPECGKPIEETIDASADAPDIRYELRRQQFDTIAQSCGYPTDAVLFVFDALSYAKLFDGRPAITKLFNRARPLDAPTICACIRYHALHYFNDRAEAADLLGEWRITTSEDVGRIIAGLSHADAIATAPDEPAFEKLFTLELLLADDSKEVHP